MTRDWPRRGPGLTARNLRFVPENRLIFGNLSSDLPSTPRDHANRESGVLDEVWRDNPTTASLWIRMRLARFTRAREWCSQAPRRDSRDGCPAHEAPFPRGYADIAPILPENDHEVLSAAL